MRDLIFVDTETGGFNYLEDPLVELTWARRDGEPRTLWFGVKQVRPEIDELIGFTKRGISGRQSNWYEVNDFLVASKDATMVAANPAFDKAFIETYGLWRFNHRMLDIETYAMAKLGLDDVPSMNELYGRISQLTDITEPDHTSRNDVLAMRDMFLFLENMW